MVMKFRMEFGNLKNDFKHETLLINADSSTQVGTQEGIICGELPLVFIALQSFTL